MIDLLNARAKLKGKASTFGTKDILARMSAVDSDIAKESDALSKILNPNSDDAKNARARIAKLNNLRDTLSKLAGFMPHQVDSDTRKATISKASGG